MSSTGAWVRPAFHPVVLVPVFDHEGAIGAMVDAILQHPTPCLLVDDGSGPACEQVLRELAAAHPGRVRLVRLPQNQGKGAALMAGFRAAAELGYTHALQIDADGQHDAACIPQFLALAEAAPEALICGHPVYDESVPKHRLYGRYLTHVSVWINTLSFEIRDSMCGMRVYPLPAVTRLMREVNLGHRMEFDTEVAVHLVWRGVRVVNVPTRVTYPADGVSHFDLLHDNVRIARMHARLFVGMLLRMPRLLWRKVVT
ncbi:MULTISPECIES: glycosyltransferase family 2 protein [unclassified Cupriavidus]|uniref:glycosyltransferase family 2 protein n=1 Tax=unclassified Cupriavidus TaxID=2640874 RepID=UPI0010F4408A|nr:MULTISPECIES: glycosyltransferase family 2 protein [unclassified Cupriavidus]MWL89474.1 glycosyltransferase [Cupriavidus sp. SW-Y-13]